jgi:hypothetical protein
MSQNRTCGECKYFVTSDYLDVCVVECETRRADSVCNHRDEFKPKVITNGDRIRQMSNERLAGFISSRVECLGGALGLADCPGDQMNCVKCWEIWLNAPAESKESEGK